MISLKDFRQKQPDSLLNDSLMIKGGASTACTDSYYWTASKNKNDSVVEEDAGPCGSSVAVDGNPYVA